MFITSLLQSCTSSFPQSQKTYKVPCGLLLWNQERLKMGSGNLTVWLVAERTRARTPWSWGEAQAASPWPTVQRPQLTITLRGVKDEHELLLSTAQLCDGHYGDPLGSFSSLGFPGSCRWSTSDKEPTNVSFKLWNQNLVFINTRQHILMRHHRQQFYKWKRKKRQARGHGLYLWEECPMHSNLLQHKNSFLQFKLTYKFWL